MSARLLAQLIFPPLWSIPCRTSQQGPVASKCQFQCGKPQMRLHARPADVDRERRLKAVPAEPHCLLADVDVALAQQVLDIPALASPPIAGCPRRGVKTPERTERQASGFARQDQRGRVTNKPGRSGSAAASLNSRTFATHFYLRLLASLDFSPLCHVS